MEADMALSLLICTPVNHNLSKINTEMFLSTDSHLPTIYQEPVLISAPP